MLLRALLVRWVGSAGSAMLLHTLTLYLNILLLGDSFSYCSEAHFVMADDLHVVICVVFVCRTTPGMVGGGGGGSSFATGKKGYTPVMLPVLHPLSI
jgi:hypothetical protein